MENARSNRSNRWKSLYAQNKIMIAMNQAVEQDQLLDAVLRELLTVLEMPAAIIEILAPDTGDFIAWRERGVKRADLLSAGDSGNLSWLYPHTADPPSCQFVEDARESDLSTMRRLAETGFHSLCTIPLHTGEGVLGHILLLARKPRTFPQAEREMLDTIGKQAGVALQRTRIYQKERQERDLAETLHRTSELLSSTLELDEVLQRILEQLLAVIPYDRAYVTMMTDGLPQIVAASGPRQLSHASSAAESLIEGSSDRVIETGRPVIVYDTQEYRKDKTMPPDTSEARKVKSWLGTPLWYQGNVRGAIILESYRTHNFHPEDAQVLTTFASQASVAIMNAQLFELVARGKQAWEETFDAMEDGISVHDQSCQMLRVNIALARMLGSTPQELVGQLCYRWNQCHEQENAFCPHDRLMKTGEAQSLDIEQDNRRYHLAVYPLRDAEGKVVGSVHSIKDITEQRQLQTQLLQAEKLSAIGELVAGVAHELNNPLTTILGYAQLLMQEEGLDTGLREDLSRIARETLRSRRIVENLLTFARKHEPEKSLININDLIEHTVEMRAYQLRVDNIEVALQLYRPLPKTMADQYQLQQLLINMINNAHQAMKEAHGGGKLLIRTSLLGESDDRYYPVTGSRPSGKPVIRIEIKDNGPGISKNVMAKMFDPFFTTKTVGQGTGLGLSICYGIVQEHDGRIWAESTPGQGATFIIEIAVNRGPAHTFFGPDRKENIVARKEHKILVVDDEEGVVAMIKRLLSKEGHDVETANNGKVALEKVLQQHFDLVISDVKMPGLGGQQLHQEIRLQRPEMARHMIFLSGDTISLETRAFLEATGSRFLRKPFGINELKQVVHEVLEA